MVTSEELLKLAVKGVGAGLSGWVNAQVSRIVPAVGAWGSFVVGAALYAFGERAHEYLKDLGEGMLIASIGQIVARYVSTAAAATAAATTAPTIQTVTVLQ